MTTKPWLKTDDPWGPHRSAIVERVASCANYLGRLQRSLAHEAALDHHYFSSLCAHDLYESARDLVRLIEEVEHLLIVCDELLVNGDESHSSETRCGLPCHHYAGHDDQPLPSLAVQVRDSARGLMDRAEDTASWVNRLGLRSDQRRAFEIEKEFDPESYEVFADLQQTASSLVHAASEVSGLIQKLIYEVPQEEWDELERFEDEDDLDSHEAEPGFTDEPPPEASLPPVRRARGLDL